MPLTSDAPATSGVLRHAYVVPPTTHGPPAVDSGAAVVPLVSSDTFAVTAAMPAASDAFAYT